MRRMILLLPGKLLDQLLVPTLDAGANRQSKDHFIRLALLVRRRLIEDVEHRLQLGSLCNRLVSDGKIVRDDLLGVGFHVLLVLLMTLLNDTATLYRPEREFGLLFADNWSGSRRRLRGAPGLGEELLE